MGYTFYLLLRRPNPFETEENAEIETNQLVYTSHMKMMRNLLPKKKKKQYRK